MVDWVHDITLVIISVGLSSLLAFGGWVFSRRRERRNARILVANEILGNYTSLWLFVGTIKLKPQERIALALHFDESSRYTPHWVRTRWDSVPLGAFSPKEIYRINDWYNQLQAIIDLRDHVASQSAMLRPLKIRPHALAEPVVEEQMVVELLENLEKFAQDVYNRGRPYVDKRIDKEHDRMREAQSLAQAKANNGDANIQTTK